jgi:hypothetical protein
MTIQVKNIVMPESALLAALSGKRTRKNTRTKNIGGYASVNADRDVTLREWQIATQPLNLSLASSIIGIYEATDAGAYGFLIFDPVDSTVSAAEGLLQGLMLGAEFGSAGFGNGCPTYGFRKVYIANGSILGGTNAITRPYGTPPVTRGGSPVTVGAAAGNIAISAGPSYVTFVADASQNVSAITPGAATSVTLASALAGLAIGGRLWLQDLTGAHAALLNNQSHQITNISGAGLNVYTLATNTAGKTITAAGTGKKYPQPTEALGWSGSYYMPVHFRDDDLEWELFHGGPAPSRQVSFTSCFLDEVRE